MSKFKYAKDGRLLFTKEMKEELHYFNSYDAPYSFDLHEKYPAKTWL
jgi:hypothetical protein